ncbi:FKBP12-associated protein [Onygenales sp. PD_40]|nr:FKBP12-associated protein [Onygenales sp. PD_40]
MCKATMNCGRHTCGERCCPGERKAIERQATKRKLKSLNIVSRPSDNDIEAEHICTRICGRMLKCSTHTCPELCHKGPCECGRLERNRTLASALNVSIDPQTTSAANPSTQTASTLPYSEETLDLYLKLSTSSTLSTLQTYQSTLHSLATSQTQRSARFPPARSQLRAFIHSLAADWGFKSESFDPEPHRHVLVFKSASWLPPHLGAAIPGSPGIGIGGLTVGDCAKMRDRERMREREREAKRLAAAAAEKLKAESHGAGDFDAAAGGGGWAQVASRKRATGPAESPFGFGELSGPSGPAKAGTLVLRSGVGKGRGAASGSGVGGGRYPPGFGDDVVDDWEEEVEKEEREREQEQGRKQEVDDNGVESKSDDAVVAEVAVGNQAEQV